LKNVDEKNHGINVDIDTFFGEEAGALDNEYKINLPVIVEEPDS